MADNKRWFKVWSTILSDPTHSGMSLESVGLWTRLGALMVQSGENGKLKITPPSMVVLSIFSMPDWDTAKHALSMLPNVCVEEGKSDNGEFTVIMKNWVKYQCDSTVYGRLKKYRDQHRDNGTRGEDRRGEEKRGEKRRKEEDNTRHSSVTFIPPNPEELKTYISENGYRVNPDAWLAHYESNGWIVGRSKMKNWKASVRTWHFNPKGGTNGHGQNGRMLGTASAVPGKYDHLG